MMVKAAMTVRNINLVVPLAHEATAMRTTDTAGSSRAASGAVSPLIGASLRQGDVDSTNGRSTPLTLTMPGIRTSTTATRTTTTRTTSSEPELSADYPARHHADFSSQSHQDGKHILDPCCGGRMMWLDKQHPDVVFGDCRSETITVTDRSHGNESGTRILRIEPDILIDFRALPYPDGSFKLVAFDPPHLERAGPRSWLAAKYGKLSENWQDDLRQGFAECFRVLDTDGVLVFKWNETQVKVGEVLALTPVQPLFGHISGRKGLTHWLVFMKASAT